VVAQTSHPLLLAPRRQSALIQQASHFCNETPCYDVRTTEFALPTPASAFPGVPPRVTFNPRVFSILQDARAAGASRTRDEQKAGKEGGFVKGL
jgi:hypothetical protein